VPEAVTSYLLFLAETVTLVAAVVAVLIAAVVIRQRARGRPPRLQVDSLNEHLADLELALRSRLLPRKEASRRAGQQRRQRRARRRTGPEPDRPRVFVLDFRGDPRASGVDALREEITAVLAVATERDEVVLRLRNPGGFVHEQGLAASQLLRVRSRGVRLTVAVDTVAASGGYMMACVADRIVAAPFAVLGSIGVVVEVPNVHRLLDRHGVDVELFTAGRYKRTVTAFSRTTDEGRQKLREQLDDAHVLFRDWVARHRPQLDLEQVATGEYWYGTRALELQLVDELGTSDEYLTAAAGRADVLQVRYTPQRSPAQRLATLLGNRATLLGSRTTPAQRLPR
jgi:serine protease SohB